MKFDQWYKVFDLVFKSILSLAGVAITAYFGIAAANVNANSIEEKWMRLFSESTHRIGNEEGHTDIDIYVAGFAAAKLDEIKDRGLKGLVEEIVQQTYPDEDEQLTVRNNLLSTVEKAGASINEVQAGKEIYFAVVASFSSMQRDLAEDWMNNHSPEIQQYNKGHNQSFVASLYKTKISNSWAVVIENQAGCGSDSARAREIVDVAKAEGWALDAFRQINRDWKFVLSEKERQCTRIPLFE